MKLLNKLLIVSAGFALSIGGCIAGLSSSNKHASAAGTTYTKVTSAPADWSGTYLVVCEGANLVFNGTTNSANANGITITNHTITGDYGAYEITIAPYSTGYSLKNSDGKYLSGKSGDNVTNFETSAKLNTIEFSNGNVEIISNTSRLRKNSGSNLFRYYKSSSYSNQTPIQLYRAGNTATITGITVKSQPQKTKYVVGESFDMTGLVLEATYDDSSTEEVTTGFTISPSGALAKTDTEITITYKEKTCTQAITVVELTGLSVSGTPTTKTYFEGQSFDPTGLTVTATYSDSSTENVTAKVSWGTLVKNVPTVTGTYGAFDVTVSGLNVKAAQGYAKVTDESELKENDQLLFVYNDEKAAGAFETKYFTAENVTLKDGLITPGSNITVFTLKGSAGSWSFLAPNGYVKATGTSNQNFELEDSISTKSQWTISFSGGLADIKNVNFTSMAIQYNSTNPRFTTYPGTQNKIELYKLSGSVDDAITNVTLDKNTTQDIIINGNVKLTATVNGGADANKNVIWSSTNNSVLALSSNLTVSGTEITVLGLAEGSATVTAKAEGDETKTASININVINPNNVKKVELDKDIIGFTLRPTCSPIQLTATVTPSLAVQSVNWASSDPDVATVSSSGLVTPGSKVGLAKITAKSTVKPEMYDTCDVVVFSKKGQEATPVQVEDMILAMDNDFYPFDTFYSSGYPIYFEGIVTAVDHASETKVSLTIEDANDANKVLRIEDGVFGTGVTVSDIVVGSKITANTVTTKLSITETYYKVKDPELTAVDNSGLAIQGVSLSGATSIKEGSSTALIVTYSPRYTNQRELEWFTSNPAVATVNNGTVTGVSEGSARITARSTANSSIEGTWDITVVAAAQVAGEYVLTSTATEYAEITTPAQFASTINGFDSTVFTCGYDTRVSVHSGSDVDDIFVAANNKIVISLDEDISNHIISRVKLGTTRTTENETTVSTTNCEYQLAKVDADYYIPVFDRDFSIEFSNKTYINYIAIEVIQITDANLIDALGQTFLDVTSGACSLLNVTSQTWTNATIGFTLCDGYYTDDVMTQLKNVEADQSGTVIQQAMARYDYIFAKYGTTLTLTNTLDRTITPMSSFVLIAREANSTLLLVVISSVSAISLVGLFLILKKKKHN